ncbi:MAG: Hsp20/alpha crystallin family protein [Spirochaetaceae bacterium]|jgi:HSP20 family protein|nr:Hsp20/alpha crystallin family protein [Spirochaetaceae bacterium]
MKAVTLYRPFTIEKALEDFDRYIDSFFGESPLSPARRTGYMPAVDIREKENAWDIEAELPGFEEKNISVQVEGGLLSIEAKMEEEVKENEAAYLMRERRKSSFSRTFKLPENADPEAVTAKYKNGVLSLTIQKRPEAQKKLIRIGVNEA